MYTTANLIYGYPINDNLHEFIEKLSDRDDMEYLDEDYFLKFYSGVHDNVPSAIGVELGEMSTTVIYTALSDLVKISNKNKIKFAKIWEYGVPAEIKMRIVREFPKGPFLFILWSSS